jgi:hypothetical protein
VRGAAELVASIVELPEEALMILRLPLEYIFRDVATREARFDRGLGNSACKKMMKRQLLYQWRGSF